MHVWVLDTATQLRELRSGLFKALTGHLPTRGEALADIPERMALVATELATNAIKHGRPPPWSGCCGPPSSSFSTWPTTT